MLDPIESQLIQSVLDNSHDDAPREAIATYWQQVNEPRHAFVKAQLQIAYLKRKPFYYGAAD
jgi:hypothetical protein